MFRNPNVQSMNEVNLYVLHREGNKVKVDRSEVKSSCFPPGLV